MRYRHFFILAAASTLVSCIGSKEFTIKTLPEGATVSINGKDKPGVTPMTVTIDQDKDLGIVVTKPGYQSNSMTVRTQSSTWLSILWTSNDPRARYIEEDEVTIPMSRIATPASFKPTVIPPYANPNTRPASQAPALRALPAGF